MSLTLIFLAIVLVILFREFYWKRRHLPPGPLPLPLLGNLLGIIRNGAGYEAFYKWTKQYSPVYTYWIGSVPVVSINDLDTLKDSVVKDGDAYADRYTLGGKGREKYRGGDYGIIDTNGYLWKEQRRFALHTLRDLGLGKAHMQQRIIEEAEFMMRTLEVDAKNGPVAIHKYLDRTVGSVINAVIFGYRFDEENQSEFFELRDMFDKQRKLFKNPLLILLFTLPQIKHFPPFSGMMKLLFEVRDAVFAFFQKQIDQHKHEIDYSSEDSRDFCEIYLKEMKKGEDDPNCTFTEPQLRNVCFDLWTAGLETTASTLAWGVLFMIRYPKAQLAMQIELDAVIGNSGRTIDYEDKKRLPYSSAVVMEMQRAANIIPQNLCRQTTRDIVLNRFPLKKGTVIVPQISSLLYDPEVFPDPYAFKPERFLNEDGELKTFEQFLPFSLGRRQCPGEGLAKVELFLFLTNLVYRFEISAEDPSNPPSMEKTLTSAIKPQPYNCRLTSRFTSS